jgi:hypothetical protein
VIGLLALAAAIRLAAWLAIPETRFASDEDSYYSIASALLEGRHDVFWPPVTGWLIALIRLAAPDNALAVVRLVWVLMDMMCLVALAVLAARFAPSIFPEHAGSRKRFITLVTIGYALYLPAISHSQFATSEIPSLLQLLIVLLLLTQPRLTSPRLAVAGLVTGTLILTRPNLLPLVITLPAAVLFLIHRSRSLARDTAVYVAAASLVIAGQLYRNYALFGEVTISTNSAYNLYIGNRDLYAEDLNLFSPSATPEQIEFRRQQFAGTLEYPSAPPSELQRMATRWILDHPIEFGRRALGRLARLFAPKTDVLELIGGQQRQSVFAPQSLLVLGVANLEWLVILAAGAIGLASLRHRDRATALVLGAVIAGAVPLCLVAISKPRYSFIFDPMLIVAAAAVLVAPQRAWAETNTLDRRLLLGVGIFLTWAWIAWAIFAVTSRI